MKGVPTLNQELKRRTKLLQQMLRTIQSFNEDVGEYYRSRFVRLKIKIK